MKIAASRLSEGNKIFPAEIHVEQTGITIKIPGLFSGESKYFDFPNIASVDINTPMMGYSTITIYAGGTKMTAHGFKKSEVQEVKQAIETGKKKAAGGYGGNNSDSMNQSNGDNSSTTNTTIVNKGPGLGNEVGKAFGSLLTGKALFDQTNKEKELLDGKIDTISSISLSGSADEIANALNKLVSMASASTDKEVKKAAVEKLEFGIMKLRSAGANAEADFFEKKVEPLKKKSWF